MSANSSRLRFLSTPSARRATAEPAQRAKVSLYFYPRPPRGGRPLGKGAGRGVSDFYPRPPRGGRLFGLRVSVSSTEFLSTPSARRATCAQSVRTSATIFLSTPSARRATSCPHSRLQRLGISIHALREEGDITPSAFRLWLLNFYPRPPRGGRQELLLVFT